jgi:hypothetical protein
MRWGRTGDHRVHRRGKPRSRSFLSRCACCDRLHVKQADVRVRSLHSVPGCDGRAPREIAQAAGLVLFAVSLIFGWMSTPQLVIMIIGLVPGVLGWAAWPVWFALVGMELSRPDGTASWATRSAAAEAAQPV